MVLNTKASSLPVHTPVQKLQQFVYYFFSSDQQTKLKKLVQKAALHTVKLGNMAWDKATMERADRLHYHPLI